MTNGRAACVRLLCACLASLLLYGLAFGFVVDRPLSLGFLRHQLDAKLARAASIDGPKLVILAGSNGPYSHRCELIEPVLAMPCVNGGVAVGIGLDYLFARWQPLLHPGDLVYLPMEEAQYVRTRAATEVGPDAAIMFRHDWRTLASLAPERWLGALFAFDLRAALMGPIEATLLIAHFHDPRAAATGATNAWGDHVGHTAELAATSQAVLASAVPQHPSAMQIGTGYGSALIADFTRWASARGVRVIGGLSTEFADAADAGRDTGCHPVDLSGQRRRVPRAAEFQPLSEVGLLRYRRAPERGGADRALEAARRAASMAPPAHCSSSSCRSSRSSGTP